MSLRNAYLAVTAAAVAIGCAAFVAGYPSVIFDSWGYYYLSGILRTKGLFGWPTDVRTYGYPLFVALVTGFRDVPPEEARLIAFGSQLAIFLGACFFVSRRLARILGSATAGFWAYAFSALNPVLLLHTTELLSDLLSAVLLQLALAFAWRLPADGRASQTASRQIFLSFFCAAAAVEVRPGNAVVVAALVLVWAFRAVRWRDVRIGSAGVALAGFMLPLIPQMMINSRRFGTLSPLIVSDLYRQQRLWGMGALKYGTVLIPGHSPFLTYVNPFYRGDPGPRSFLLHHPVEYVTTLALHAFAMLDSDLPFTYITNLRPGYRWPLSIVNYLLLYLALVGCLLSVARVLRRRPIDETAFALWSTVVVCAAYLAIYLPVEVESRFGLALELLMTPLVVTGALWFVRTRPKPHTARTLLAVGAPAFVLSCALLSAWISTTQTSQFVSSPANAFVLDPPRAALRATPPAGGPAPPLEPRR